mmetsp:Transcript_20617/g.43703  ORF Transcript_20617/g.43703 Transcript_20617/m.43703 type:complete len:401 (-) Transcript_20617:123-1325(-)
MDVGSCRVPLNMKYELPSTFRVLGAKIHGDYDSVLEFQSLEVNDGNTFLQIRPADVLVKICFTDVNPVDLQKLRGRDNDVGRSTAYPPHVPGYGGSGVVVKVGSAVPNADEWKGKSVCFLADPTRMGSYATYIVVDVNCVAKIPCDDGLIRLAPTSNANHESSSIMRCCASIPIAGLTAFESLAKCGLVNASESNQSDRSASGSLLIVGAAGGVGSWTIALAKALNPCLEIIATASTQAQHDWCTALGADIVIRHDAIGSRLEGGREGSVDTIVCLTEPTPDLFGTLSEVVKPYGSICLVSAGKSIGSLDLGFCFFKCVDVKTETVFSSIRTKYRNIVPAKELELIIDLIARGKIKAPLSPELENGNVSESIQNATDKNGVLEALSQPTGRRGNFVMKVD